MRAVLFILAVAAVVFTAPFALAEDCEYINNEKVCWDGGTETTLGWTYSHSTVGKYQIEVRDFNWLGSVFLKVTMNNTERHGMIPEGEAFIFDFTNGSGFDGIKVIANKVSNINPMPANIGTYPGDPQAKITVKLPVDEEKKKPTLKVSISTEGEAKAGSKMIATVEVENSGDDDLIGTDLDIYYGGLKLIRDYDAYLMSEDTLPVQGIQWENVSKYRLTPLSRTILKDGFFIEVLDFSERTASISAAYNLSTQKGTLNENSSIIFNFTRGREYRGVKILGSNFSDDSADLTLALPVKNLLKRSYPYISKGNKVSTKLGFLIPFSLNRSFTINVAATGKDMEGAVYTSTGTAAISASDTLAIKKRTTDSILGARLYPEYYPDVGGIRSVRETTSVTLRVDNLQSYPIHGARLTDTIPPSFSFPDDENRTSISWDFDINASEYREFKYQIMAKRQGVYNLPEAELTWSERGELMRKQSESPRTTVSGPYIGIDRSFNKNDVNIGDPVQVTLSIINYGDVPTNITVNESVPVNAIFRSGNLSFSGFLNPGEQAGIVYNITARGTGTLEFRQPVISSRNQGFDWHAPLPVKKLQVMSALPGIVSPPSGQGVNPAGQPEKGLIQSIDEKMPWLEGAVSMITFLFAIFLLLTLNKINRIL